MTSEENIHPVMDVVVVQEPANFMSKRKLTEYSTELKQRFHNNFATLALVVKKCLDEEHTIVTMAEGKCTYCR